MAFVALTCENRSTNETAPAGNRGLTNTFRLRSDVKADTQSRATAPTSVYRYYDTNGVLLYVGITSRGTSRQREHNSDKDWWPFVSRQEVDHYPSRPEAAQAERDLILRFRPPFNTQHHPGHAEARSAYLALVRSEISVNPAAHLWDKPRGVAVSITDYCWDDRGRFTYWFKSYYDSAARYLPYLDGVRWVGLPLGNGGKSAKAQLWVEGLDIFGMASGHVRPPGRQAFIKFKFTSQKPPRIVPSAVTLLLPARPVIGGE